MTLDASLISRGLFRSARHLFFCLGILSVANNAYGDKEQDDLVEKAWRCNPAGSPPEIYFQSDKCSPPQVSKEEEARLVKALIDRYVTIETNRKGRQNVDPGAFYAERERRLELAGQQYRLAQQQKEQNENAAKYERKRQLVSGATKPSNMEDVLALVGKPKSLLVVMASPMLQPNKSEYFGNVLIDAQEKEGVLRGKAQILEQGQYRLVYVWLRLNSKTANFAPERMRIGGAVSVGGVYAANTKYRTVLGEERTAPLIDVRYVGEVVPSLMQQ